MKPKAVDKELWDEIYNIYVKDKFGLGLQAYFEKQDVYKRQELLLISSSGIGNKDLYGSQIL